MLGFEYGFTKLLVNDFWYPPLAPQPFCEAVDWGPILEGLQQRVDAKIGTPSWQKPARVNRPIPATTSTVPPVSKPTTPVVYDDETLGQFGL